MLELEPQEALSALARLVAEDPTSTLPLLVASPSAAPAQRIEMLETGAYDVLRTVEPREIAARLSTAVRMKRRHDEALERASQLRRMVDEQERRLRSFLETVGLVAVMLDRKGTVTFCNEHLAHLLERPREAILGRSWFEVALPEPLRSEVQGVFESLLVDEQLARHYENEVVSSTGARRLIEWSNTVLRDRDGRVEGVAGIGRDVTRERRATTQMRIADLALETSVIGIAIADMAGTLTRVNDAFVRLFGLASRDEAVGRHATSFWSSPEAAFAVMGQILTEGGAEGELEARTRQGPRTMRLRASLIRTAEGAAEGMMASFTDVTDHRKAEARLHEAQRIGRIGNWEWNRDASTLWWSDEVYRIFGRSPSSFEVTLDAFFGCVLEEDRPNVLAAIEQAFASGRRYSVDHRIERPDGSIRWVQENAELWAGPNGALIGMRGTVQDITERHAADQELRRANELLRTVLANAPVIIFALDKRGVFTLSEGRALEAIGLMPGEVVGRSALELYADVEGVRESIGRALAGEPTTHSGRLRDVDFEAVYAPLFGPSGEIEGVIGVGLDVTERKRLEAQLGKAQKMEALGLLAGGVAHDFNNLLAVILSGVQLVEGSGRLDGEAADDLRHVQEAANRAAALTKQLLAFGHRQPLDGARVELNEVIRSVKEMLRRLIGEPIALHVSLEEDLPPVVTDRAQLDQVLMNLVVNARDAMPAGGTITITTRRRTLRAGEHASLSAGEYATLIVEDTGVGMAPAVLARIFEPFFTTKGPGKGTGLGLATLHGIVGQSGGAVDVRSAPGKGTTFTVWLPAAEGRADTARGRPDTTALPDPAGSTVLIVEDDPQVRYVAVRILERAGIEVVAASDPGDALDRLRKLGARVSLVLSDVVMPHMSGVELERRAREELGTSPPFLFM
ncbi:MAG: PAS domain S-box protein, partial [Sandaracinaceae bacterium]|nr:PAS domain S-box protein [Sandaracinaceae bacterium]